MALGLMLSSWAGIAGASPGFRAERTTTYTMYSAASIRPGTIEPRNRSPTDTPSSLPSTTRTTLGGMTCPSVPEAAITPPARPLS